MRCEFKTTDRQRCNIATQEWTGCDMEIEIDHVCCKGKYKVARPSRSKKSNPSKTRGVAPCGDFNLKFNRIHLTLALLSFWIIKAQKSLNIIWSSVCKALKCEVNCLFIVTIKDISVISVTEYRRAGGLKKEVVPRVRLPTPYTFRRVL